MTTLDQLAQACRREDRLCIAVVNAANEEDFEHFDALLTSAIEAREELQRRYNREQRRAAK